MKTCTECIYKETKHTIKEYNKNEYIFFEEDPIKEIYFIKEGIVLLTKLHSNGEEKVMDVLRDGDFIALLLFLQMKENYLVTAKAVTEVTLEVIQRKDALHNYKENAAFKEVCMQCATHRLGNFQTQLFSSSNVDPEEKVIQILTHLYNKFGYMKNNKHFVKLPITKQELANMIGLRRETLSRKLSKLKKDNIIDVKKNIYEIKNM